VTALDLTRSQILAYRRRVGSLIARQAYRRQSLEHVASAGLKDSMPRAAVLSLHARIEGVGPLGWDDPAFVQVWGPGFSVFVVAKRDLAVFTLGRLPDDPFAIEKAYDLARRLDETLAGERVPLSEAGRMVGVHHNQLRYAAPTGTVLVRWEGGGKPLVWTVPPPQVDPIEARLELARRYVHGYGPTSAPAFSNWAGIAPRLGHAIFEMLKGSLTEVRTPIGRGLILSSDEESFLAEADPPAPVRLLPSGDSFWLLHGEDRDLLVSDPREQSELWTSRVWPGALLVEGQIGGTWRRADHRLSIRTWRTLSADEREAVEIEAASLPLPELSSDIQVTWEPESARRDPV
jgi:hypothetical protein